MDHKKEIFAIVRDCIADGLITEIGLGEFKKTYKALDKPHSQPALEDFLQEYWDLVPGNALAQYNKD